MRLANVTSAKTIRNERGSAVVSFVILAPVIVMVTLMAVQASIIGYVRHSVTLAASTALDEAVTLNADIDLIRNRTIRELEINNGWALSPEVEIVSNQIGRISGVVQLTENGPSQIQRRNVGEGRIEVSIRAKAFRVLPMGDFNIEVTQSKAVESPQR